jgi:hypothetical protein
MELCDLPRDIIKMIIEFCPYGQWFRLSKELSTLASQAISPLNCRTSENGALRWAVIRDKALAATSLLKDPRIDPSLDNNWAIRCASFVGQKEVVEILLKDNRVNPSDVDNQAVIWASWNGHTEIVEMLLQDKRVNPSDCNYETILYANKCG